MLHNKDARHPHDRHTAMEKVRMLNLLMPPTAVISYCTYLISHIRLLLRFHDFDQPAHTSCLDISSNSIRRRIQVV